MFTWLPLYKEVAQWVLQYRNRQTELCNILREIGFEKNLTDEDQNGKKIPLEVMDPISFFGYFQKPKSEENRKKFWSALIAREGFTSSIPADFSGLPSAQPMNLWMFKYKKDRKPKDMDDLWDLAEQAIHGNLKEDTFNSILAKPGIGVAKLTQGLFWLNSEKFYPIDAHKAYLDKSQLEHEVNDLSDYLKVIDAVKRTYQKPFYQISHDAWQNSQIEDDATNPAEDIEKSGDNGVSFIDRIEKYDENILTIYIQFLQNLMKDLNLKYDDKRIVFSVRRRRLNFIVGQRYCINIYRDADPQYIGFISSKKLPTYDSDYNGQIPAFYNTSTKAEDLTKYKDDIYKAIQYELSRSRVSGFLSSDNPEFRSQIFQVHVIKKVSNERLQTTSLNTILYGPPGTGKTYESVIRAAEIVKNQTIESYTEAKQIFNDNLHERIEFITFHQNYSYEDFIQGIRPDIENNKSLTFEKKDGVFKIIADRALQNLIASEKQIERKKEFDVVFKEFLDPLIEGEVEEIEVKMKKVAFFITEVGNKSIEFRKASGGTDHSLSIATLKKMYDAETVMEIQGLSSYYTPLLGKLLNLGKISKNQAETVTKNNYVIIIDEINRANISRVFGELITLIEPDKRSHGANPLKAKLPSGDTFIVPSNLYIIGTMNTADKSIALLDIALRRRFEFISMYPKYVINGHEIYDVEVLRNINEQIISSKGHDFQIGHSYFMKENKDLVQRMNNKVIPLLLEYFMNDEKEVKNILYKAGLDIEPDSGQLEYLESVVNLFEYQNKVPFTGSYEGIEKFLDLIWANREKYSYYNRSENAEIESQRFIQFLHKTNEIKSNKFVGVIHFGGQKINLLPKVFFDPSIEYQATEIHQIHNHILWWLSYCRKIKFPNYRTALSGQKSDFFEVLIYLFSKYTKELLSNSIFQRFEEVEGQLNFIKGRLNTSTHIKQNVSTGQWQKLNCTYDSFVLNNEFNQIIKYVATLLFGVTISQDSKKNLREILFILDEVSDIRATANQCSKIKFNPFHGEFETVRDYCHLFLSNYVSFNYKNDLKLFAFLLPMEYVFEDFIFGFIEKELPNVAAKAQKSNIYLDESKQFNLVPDLLLTIGQKSFIADTKYKIVYSDEKDPKKGISQSDLYQLLAYAVRFNVDDLILFYPNTIKAEQDNKAEFLIEDTFADNRKIRIRAFQIPILNKDLLVSEFDLKTELGMLFEQTKLDLKEKLERILLQSN